MDYLIMTNILFSQFRIKFLIIKAKYMLIEPHYMEGSTPDQPTAFVSEPECQKKMK
jgi:hypothetical protein